MLYLFQQLNNLLGETFVLVFHLLKLALVVGLGAVAVATLIGVSVGLVIALARPWAGRRGLGAARRGHRLPDAAPRDAHRRGLRSLPGDGDRRDWRGSLGRRRAPDTASWPGASSPSSTCWPPAPRGVSTWGILTRHVLPNIWPTLATNLAVTMGGAVLAEAGLS